ncbi:MAG: hypothetical protein ACFFBD_17945 [Candidatus Hodarchaeota archaeon]
MISEDANVSKTSLTPPSSESLKNKPISSSFFQKLGLVLFRFEDIGAVPYLETTLPTLSPIGASEVINTAGVAYLCGLGQGDAYHTGLFGPVPVPGARILNALLFSFFKNDQSIQDTRAEHQAYLVLTIIFRKKERNKFLRVFGQINQQLSLFFTQFSSVESLPPELLQTIVKIIDNLVFCKG